MPICNANASAGAALANVMCAVSQTLSKLVADTHRGCRLVPFGSDCSQRCLIGLLLEVGIAGFDAADPVLREGVFDTATRRSADMCVTGPDAVRL